MASQELFLDESMKHFSRLSTPSKSKFLVYIISNYIIEGPAIKRELLQRKEIKLIINQIFESFF